MIRHCYEGLIILCGPLCPSSCNEGHRYGFFQGGAGGDRRRPGALARDMMAEMEISRGRVMEAGGGCRELDALHEQSIYIFNRIRRQ